MRIHYLSSLPRWRWPPGGFSSRAGRPVVDRQTSRAQKIDEEYTRLIQQHLQDPRITTELVDHLPASDTVPSPLKFLGRAVGTPGELTYAKDIHRYYEALGEGGADAREVLEDRHHRRRPRHRRARHRRRGDDRVARHVPRHARRADRSAEDDAKRARSSCCTTAKPIYYVISGMHSPENGGPEMLIELAYRLIVEETPFIQNIRNNVITLITPVIEVDGREKQVDTYYFNKKRAPGDARLPLMYWGKYVQHDNNRDGMGQFLELTQAVTQLTLDWHPTIIHDLHEAQTYLYSSTGTGPVQRRARSDHRQRMVDAGAERRDGDDQARRARRLDLRVLRRLGAELHVLHRAQPQRDRPVLRGAELRPRQLRSAPGHRRSRARNGSGRIRRCRTSSGVRATTRTSSSRRCCSR